MTVVSAVTASASRSAHRVHEAASKKTTNFTLCPLPRQPERQLQLTSRLSRGHSADHEVPTRNVRIPGSVQHVEKVGIESQIHGLCDRYRLEDGSIERWGCP